MLTRNQKIARIWGIAKKNAMDSDNLHDYIYGLTEKDSIKKLTDKQLDLVIFRMGENGSVSTKSRTPKKSKFNQDQYFEYLKKKIKTKYKIEYMDSYLNKIAQSQFCKNFIDLQSSEKGKMIGVLKALI